MLLWWLVLDQMACWARKLCTEALQSCLPHQLDLRTGQLWAEGRSTLQLHEQRLIPEVQGFLMTSVVLPPDSEIVAPFLVSGVWLGSCALVEPSRSLTEEYGVVVGHTLVDASSRSSSVLMINPNAEEIVLISCVGGSRGSGPARRYVRSPAGPFGENCYGISPFIGGSGSTVAA